MLSIITFNSLNIASQILDRSVFPLTPYFVKHLTLIKKEERKGGGIKGRGEFIEKKGAGNLRIHVIHVYELEI